MQKHLLTFVLVIASCYLNAQSPSILSAKKKLSYQVIYTDSIQKISIRDTVTLEITNKPWRFDSLRQRTVVWTRRVNKLNASNKAKVFCLGTMQIDSASAMETEREFWLTLPRNDYFAILQIAPGARFIKSARVNDVYSSLMKIGPGWGMYENMELQNEYKATRRDALQVKGKNYLYLQIDAIGTCKFGTNKVSYYFNEDLGLLGAEFRFYNSVRLQLKLLSIEE